jgi:hypothetical protein
MHSYSSATGRVELPEYQSILIWRRLLGQEEHQWPCHPSSSTPTKQAFRLRYGPCSTDAASSLTDPSLPLLTHTSNRLSRRGSTSGLDTWSLRRLTLMPQDLHHCQNGHRQTFALPLVFPLSTIDTLNYRPAKSNHILSLCLYD